MKGTPASSTILDYLKAGKKPPRRNAAEKRSKGETRKYNPNTNSYTNSKSDVKKNNIKCYRCGKPHLATKCTLSRDVRCHGYGKQGHLSTICFSQGSANQLQEILSLEHTNHRDKFLVTLTVNGKPMEFEVDSGAAVTVVNDQIVHRICPGPTIFNTQLQLVSYCGRIVRSKGYITVNVKYKNKTSQLNMYIIGVRESLY